MIEETMHEQDRQDAIDWARRMLQSDALILDTETTGLGSDAEIVQIAIIDMAGRTILDCLVQPIGAIPLAASNIHGITADRVQVAPLWADLWPAIRSILAERTVVIYNANYDTRLLGQSCALAGFLFDYSLSGFTCAMQRYSAYVGDWNNYHGNYRWQKLPSGDHSALGDCLATLAVLKQMAGA
jgi:DNA polymerase-3 subunit epsilon